MKTVNIVNLGCAKNIVDSEFLARQLELNGYKTVYDEDTYHPFTLINTCGFIHDAQEESVDTILEAIQFKNEHPDAFVGVFGCLTGLFKNELEKEIPEVDAWFGKYDIEHIIGTLNGVLHESHRHERIMSTPNHYAYLKIAEGCNRKCAFCSIPKITGNYTSVPLPDLIKQAEDLAKKGVKELLLIAQDLTLYGNDLQDKPTLTDLIRAISKIDSIEWIRLHYAYPVGIPDDLFEEMRTNPKVCRYLDIPIQHINDEILSAMKRGHNSDVTKQLIRNLRTQVPGIALRTTLIVGFPNETDEQFNELLSYIEEARFEKMGAFPYSHENYTSAYETLEDTIEDDTKQQRLDTLMEAQHAISQELTLLKIGQELKAIIDRKEDGIYFARSEFDSPEVDGEIQIETNTPLEIGKFCIVKITDADAYDLIGEVVSMH
ncbi:MAG: 30S ribosomal protein S12 methylthiotransferase RimO [Salinivirgaceae bacterium]